MPQTDLSVDRTPLVLLVVLGFCFGAAVGILASLSLLAGAALAAVFAIAALSLGRLPIVASWVLVLAIGVPLSGVGAGADTFLSIPLGSIHPPFQIVLVVGVTVLTVVLATEQSLSYLASILRRGASGAVVLWVTACFVLFLLGVGRNGLAAAGRQFMFLSVYLWVVPVIVLSRRRAAHALSTFLALILVGTTLSALFSLTIFAVAPVRSLFFSASQGAQSVRVGFGTASVYPLVLPIALLLAGNKSAGRLRLLGLVSSLLMIGAVLVSQSRAVMAGCALNVILVILMPGAWKLGVRRWRVLGISAFAALILVVALVMASSLGIRNAMVLPQELSQRLGSLISVSNDPNYQTRRVTNDIAVNRWQTSPVTIISGQGLGVSVGYYEPGSARPYDVSLFVDNAWATLAVQGGLIALTTFALVLIAALVSFVRVARLPADPLELLIARALALSLPGLLFESTLFTSHLLQSPSVVVALCSLLAAADVVWCFHRRANARTVDVPGQSRGSDL